MSNKTPNGNELAAALRASIKSLDYAVTALQAPAKCAMREDLAKARAALATHDAQQEKLAVTPIIGDATSELRRLLEWCTDPQRDVTANPYLQAPVRRAMRYLEAIDAHNPSALSDLRELSLERRAS